MEEIGVAIETADHAITEFDSVTVRQLVSCVKVVNKDRILVRFKDGRVDEFVRKLFQEELLEDQGAAFSLCASPSVFKGEKPALLILPSGETVKASTWKNVAAAVMQDCNSDLRRHKDLLWLRERLHGNFRRLLASSPEGMGAPLRIDEGLYMESKFDTEALLQNLTEKILKKVGYDYSGVVIQCRTPQQEIREDFQMEQQM